MLRACVLDFGGIWDVHLPLEVSLTDYVGRSWRRTLIGPELVKENTEKISQIKDRHKATHDRQKSYADKRRKSLEFSVGDHVLLKVSPRKGVVHFGRKGKLAPRFVRPFEIIERIDSVAYRLRLPKGLNGVHDTFHMSNLKKCLAGPTLQVPLDKIQVDAKLNFMKEPMEILEREFKKLKWSRITTSRFKYQVLRMISEAELQALADLKSILYGWRSERFGIELCVKLKNSLKYVFEVEDHHDTFH
ncbi:hypothetical protein Tco_0247013 [Tanacetum coccineum]